MFNFNIKNINYFVPTNATLSYSFLQIIITFYDGQVALFGTDLRDCSGQWKRI